MFRTHVYVLMFSGDQARTRIEHTRFDARTGHSQISESASQVSLRHVIAMTPAWLSKPRLVAITFGAHPSSTNPMFDPTAVPPQPQSVGLNRWSPVTRTYDNGLADESMMHDAQRVPDDSLLINIEHAVLGIPTGQPIVETRRGAVPELSN